VGTRLFYSHPKHLHTDNAVTALILDLRFPPTARLPSFPKRTPGISTLLSSSGRSKLPPSSWYERFRPPSAFRWTRNRSHICTYTFDAIARFGTARGSFSYGTITGAASRRPIYERSSGGGEWSGADDQPGKDEDDGDVEVGPETEARSGVYHGRRYGIALDWAKRRISWDPFGVTDKSEWNGFAGIDQ
jgi:hypothetical protein